MPQQRPAKIAYADQSGIPGSVYAQGLLDGRQQVLHIVADSAHAKFTEVSQILPDLRRIHTARPGQTVRGNDVLAVLKQNLQGLNIYGQTLNGGPRDVSAFQADAGTNHDGTLLKGKGEYPPCLE